MKRIFGWALLFLLAILLSPHHVKAQDARTQADKAFGEQSYSRALTLYRQVLAATPEGVEKTRIEHRIAESLLRTDAWLEAVTLGEKLAREDLGRARALYFLGRLYTKLPSSVFKLNGKIIAYGDDVPEVAGAVKPQQDYVNNGEQSLKYLQDAKIQAQRDRTLRRLDALALKSDEEIDLNFDLAATLAANDGGHLIETLNLRKPDDLTANFDEDLSLAQRFEGGWSMPKKVLWLHLETRALDRSANKRDSALSLLSEGLFLRPYRDRMDQWARRVDDKNQPLPPKPYPFDDREARDSWRTLATRYANTDLAPQALLLVAQDLASEGELIKAKREYEVLVARYPKVKWASDARAALQEITRREVSLDTLGAQQPGRAAKLNYVSRNIQALDFVAYRIALEKYLLAPDKLNDANIAFTQFTQNFGTIENLTRQLGAPVARWSTKTPDKKDFHGVSSSIDTPLDKLGAYVIVATPRGSKTLRAARLLIVSDLAILRKVDRKKAFAFVAQAKSGEGEKNISVAIKEVFPHPQTGQTVDALRGRSDDAGFFDKARPARVNSYNTNVQVLAWDGARYALTGNWSRGWYDDERANAIRVLGYTDRPVYRPGQTVYWRAVVTRQERGGQQSAAINRKVKVTIRDAKGREILDKEFSTGEFGTINSELVLPADVPLGAFSMSLQVLGGAGQAEGNGAAQFRVEEYKRPEFEVSVDAPDNAVRAGETVAARINAKYYFGAPVPNATVKYTVRKRTWWADFKFPSPHDWLLDTWNVSWNPWDQERRNIGGEGSGAIVAQGTTKTDSAGIAEVSFKTLPIEKDDENGRWWWRRYSNPLYAIEVEVTDASRRVIEGAGSVKVAGQDYFAFLNTPRGFAEIGDRVEIEVRTQNANDKPEAATGKMVVYRQLPNDKEEKVYEEPVATDATGRLFWRWESDAAGEFRVAWEGLDSAGNKVTASTNLWINGPQLNQIALRSRGVTLVLDKRVYEEGDTLQVLVVADKPNTNVLLTQEADGEVLRRDVLQIEGKSRTFSIKIGPEHVPNFAIAAAIVKDFEVMQAQAEVFVPPVKSLLKVQVKGDREQYKPGESGTFEVSAVDYAGNPARAEISLALVDASLFYIQRDTTPDIRQHFYSERRNINVSLDSHRSGVGEARLEDEAKYGKYETHEWTQPDDLGQLNLDPSGGYGWQFRRNYRGASRGRGDVQEFEGGFGGAMMSDSAAPAMAMAAPAPSGAKRREVASMSKASELKQAPLQEAKVRTNFAETAFWSPAVVTENGSATVKVTFPDSLTQWHASARGLTTSAQVGAGETDTETKKNLLVRLQAPRFFVQNDQVALTANVHNYLKTPKRIKISLQTGDALQLASKILPSTWGLVGENLSSFSDFIEVAPGEEKRVNWIVDANRAGDAKIRMTAQSDEDADAVEMSFPILVHGAPRFAGQTGVLRADGAQSFKINFPKERKMGASQLNVQLNPSLAAVMLDALPYLADYPYGCVEQTTSRFVPAVLVAKTLRESGVSLQVLAQRAKAYAAESKATSPSALVKNSGYSFPKGMPNSRDMNRMAENLWYTGRAKNPIFNPKELDAMIGEGLARLVSMQRADGGWGWWAGSDNSDEWMSAYVVYALALAADADVKVPSQVLDKGFSYLEKQMRDEEDLHLLTHIGHALSMRHVIKRGVVSKEARQVLEGRLFDQRARLTTYSKSLLAMALWNIGEKPSAQVLVRNLEASARIDAKNQTAHWETGRDWWRWWNNDNEANATALRAFLLIDPKNALVQPVVKWLVAQSRASRWDSTRDTALAVYALSDYVRINRELDVDYTLRVSLNGKISRTYRVTRDNALFFDNRFISSDLFLQDGANTLSIEKKGRGNVYWSATSEYFSLENPIKASGNALSIKRRFFKLTPKKLVEAGQVLVPTGDENRGEYTRSEILDGSQLRSGEEVEVELLVDSPNDYEYVVFEDMKAAGMEPQQIRSGSSWGDGLSSNVELRDDKVAFFVDRLPQGKRVLRYRMRVEIPGRFHALPTNGYAMYAPEARATSDELRVGVQDALASG